MGQATARSGFKMQMAVDRWFLPVPAVGIVYNNRNHPEPRGTAGQPAVGF